MRPWRRITAALSYPHVLRNCQDKRFLLNKNLAKPVLEFDKMEMID